MKRIPTMKKPARSILQGLREAVAYAKGTTTRYGYRVRVPRDIDVKAIRRRLGLTQDEFAGRFGVSVNTLRHWEQGTRRPEGASRAYLVVIARAPRVVERALRARSTRSADRPSVAAD